MLVLFSHYKVKSDSLVNIKSFINLRILMKCSSKYPDFLFSLAYGIATTCIWRHYLCPGPCYLPGLHLTPKRLSRVWNKSQKCVACNWKNSFKLHCSLKSTVTSSAKYMTYLNSSQSNKLRYNLFRKAFVVTWSPNWPLTGRGENCASSWKRSYQSMLRLCMLFLLPFPTQRGVRIRIVLT